MPRAVRARRIDDVGIMLSFASISTDSWEKSENASLISDSSVAVMAFSLASLDWRGAFCWGGGTFACGRRLGG